MRIYPRYVNGSTGKKKRRRPPPPPLFFFSWPKQSAKSAPYLFYAVELFAPSFKVRRNGHASSFLNILEGVDHGCCISISKCPSKIRTPQTSEASRSYLNFPFCNHCKGCFLSDSSKNVT